MIPRAIPRAALPVALLAIASVTSAAGATGCGAAPPPAVVAPSGNTPPWPQTLDHPSTPETHRRAVDDLFEAIKLKSVLEGALDSSLRTQMSANPKLRPLESVMRRFMGKYLSLEGVREPLARLYMDRFSELEIVQLTAFYRTPLGQRTTAELPKLMEEGGRIGIAKVQEHMDELKEMIQKQLQGP